MPKKNRAADKAVREADAEARIEKALHWVSEHVPGKKRSLRQAADRFGIKRTQLTDRFHGGCSKREAHTQHQALLPEEESVIAEFAIALADRNFPITLKGLRKHANYLLHLRDPDYDDVGQHWHKRFLERHPDVNTRWRHGLDRVRATAANPESVRVHFEKLDEIISKHNLPPTRIFNMDEKGCLLGIIQSARILVRRNAPPSAEQGQYCAAAWDSCFYFDPDGNREMITIIECICADGTSIAPTYIFKGKNLQTTWYESDPIDAHYATSPNGWTDNELGEHWIRKVFDPATADKSDETRLIILDGHSSHVSFEFVQYAMEHDIELYCLPSHSTAELQPLDVVIFSPLAHAWSEEVESHGSSGLTVMKSDFCRLYAAARAHAFGQKLILKAFEATGIQPFNPKRIQLHRNVPARAAERGTLPMRPPSLIHALAEPSEGRLSSPPPLLSRITHAMEIEANNPGMAEVQDVLKDTLSELRQSAAREALTAKRAAEIEERISKRKNGKRRKVGGARLLTHNEAFETLRRKNAEDKEKEERRQRGSRGRGRGRGRGCGPRKHNRSPSSVSSSDKENVPLTSGSSKRRRIESSDNSTDEVSGDEVEKLQEWVGPVSRHGRKITKTARALGNI